MYLKSLEMNGFKSFADRTRLDFHPGVTGIVGPNGCGKSNVVDAIRWVLGETSAKALRGDEMADVIFNGTEMRKPLGMAEVQLTLADCETCLPIGFHEVSVGRRVYRDGKSEYLINRTPCRLRDIHDLFVDTGIGRACYSIMQQGKIDLLLSSKPEDRRQVFEEAAGITKFKQQKNEALRKLEATDANLLRVADVMEEQQRQMSSLQRQAAKARRYAALLRQLRVLDMHWSHRLYGELRQERERAAGALENVRRQQQETAKSQASTQTSLGQTRARLHHLDRELRDLQQALSEAVSRIDSARRLVEFNEERSLEWRSLMERNESEIATLQARLEEEKKQLSEAGAELHRRSSRLLSHEERLAGVLQALEHRRRERQEQDALLRETQQRMSRCDAESLSRRAQIESLHAQLRAQEERRAELAAGLEEAEAALGACVAQTADGERRVLEARTAVGERASELTRLESALAAREEAHRQLIAEVHECSRQFASQQARLEMLRQLVASGEGLEAGTRQVLRGLDEPDRFQSAVYGALVSFLQVEEEWLGAVEAALGPAIQAVLVRDDSAAVAILDALRERKLGHASLVAPDAGRPNAGAGTAPEGSLGWLLDCVELSDPGSLALERLLGGVALAQDLAAALRLRQAHPSLAVVTLSGDFISAHGVISGGSRDPQAGSALRIQREIRKLRKLTREMETGLASLQERAGVEELQVSQSRSEAADCRERLQAAQQEAARLEAQWKLAQWEVEQTGARRQQVLAEQSALHRLQASNQRQCADLEVQLRLVAGERDELARSLPSLEQGLRQLQQLEETTAEDAARLRTDVAVEKQSVDSLRQQLGPLHSRLGEWERSLRQRRSETDTHLLRIQTTRAESERLCREIAATEQEVVERRASVDDLQQRREDLARESEAVESALEDQRQTESRLTQEAAVLEVRITQHDLRIENLADQISQRYQLDLAAFQPDLPALLLSMEEQRQTGGRTLGNDPEAGEGTAGPGAASEPDWRFVEEVLPGMRRKLESLGSVNLDAIAEFEELEDRFRLIRSQHDDLTKSREELGKIIARINRTTRQLFADTFEQVASNFRDMFTELFGRGAQADLVLLDEQDPLGCGIEIIAKPPGKKLQSINLLSGGERSMTAVALLFAIYMVKPSPFCVLDELDAPLDEANIERFCRVLDRFCGQSQFVIVTHSKRTMHRADVMYGISMEERGVSKTLSVRLTPAAEARTSAA